MSNFIIPCIVTPLDIQTLKALNYNKADERNLVIVNLTRNLLYDLFEKDFFERINYILDTNIDDFEDEEVTDIRKLIILRNFLRDWIKENPEEIYKQLFNLVSIAIEKETGVFFFF